MAILIFVFCAHGTKIFVLDQVPAANDKTYSIYSILYLYSATESLMYGGGGSRRGSYDTEYSDDSNDSRQTTPKSRPFKVQSTPPKKKDLQSKKQITSNIKFEGRTQKPLEDLCSFM